MSDVLTRAHRWIVSNDTGESSKAIWSTMMGVDRKSWSDHPYDPGDLGRCLRLLALIPEWQPRVGEMSARSAYWRVLVERWDEVAQAMAEEVGIGWSKGRSAPRTYALMQAIFLPVDMRWGLRR